MKKFISFLIIICAFTVGCIYFTEKTDFLGLNDMEAKVSFHEKDGRLSLSWEPLPYPCFYRVDTFYKTTGLVEAATEFHLVSTQYTRKNICELSTTAIPLYYRITAYGIFGSIAGPFRQISNPNYPIPPVPVSIFHYTEKSPASPIPFLVWHSVPDAVCYEVELLSAPPETEGGLALSAEHHLFSTQQIYTNGWQADLRPFLSAKEIYWRVRALNLQKQPIGFFSKAEKIYVDSKLPIPNKPLINNFDQMPSAKMPLYPVYHWIPMYNTLNYEVELMVAPPKEENNTLPSPHRSWHMKSSNIFSVYDEYARPYAGTYYWRVRGIDGSGNTVGVYSDTAAFTVESHSGRVFAAALGDSITHGGGAVSYSPADQEYNYMTYLDFPALNLGRSGDTVHTTMLRFDADVLPYRPYNLLILAGSNNLRSETTSEEIISDLEIIRKKCEHYDIRPIFLTLMPINPENIFEAFHSESDPDWHKKLTEVNAYIRKQPYFIDLEPYFYDATGSVMDKQFAIDGLHPDIRGKMLMGEIINAHRDLFRE